MFKQSVLKNKMKIISANIPGAHGVTSAVFVRVGSRYETDRLAGLSHFIEHMVFKGTVKRPRQTDISRAIEGRGGYLNAATGHDHTFFYTRVPERHWRLGLEVLADILLHPLLRPKDIQLESGVIVEELNMYRDTPVRYIYNLIMSQVWPENPLGRDILGDKKSILAVRQPDFIGYMRDFYQPQNMAAAAAGKIEHTEFSAAASKLFAGLENQGKKNYRAARGSGRGVLIHEKKTDQAHLCLAASGLPYNHRDMPALVLLDTILGSGMSSRLFSEIREKRGLCYSIHSFLQHFEDTGLVGVAAGLKTNRMGEAVPAILAEMGKFKSASVAKTELKEAKEFVAGTTLLEMDNSDALASWYGLQGLFYKRVETPQEKIKKLLKVTPSDIMRVARKLFRNERLNLAVIGPFGKSDEIKFKKMLKLTD